MNRIGRFLQKTLVEIRKKINQYKNRIGKKITEYINKKKEKGFSQLVENTIGSYARRYFVIVPC